jgi:dipeptidyl-peptidase-4
MLYLRLVLIGFIFILLANISLAQPPKSIKWAKDGNSYYAIENNEIVQYLLPSFERVIVAPQSVLTPEGAAQPIVVSNFYLSDDNKKILLYTNSKRVWRLETRGDYWVLDKAQNHLFPIGKGKEPSSLMFAKIAPDGSKVAYVYQHNIYVEDLDSHKTTRLTNDGNTRRINGTFDWAYEEEFGCRDGFRWSPDSKQIAYWQIGAEKIRNFLLINNTDSLYSFTIPVEYPKAGEDPSSCRVGVVQVATGKTKWMNVPGDAVQHYIPRMEWAAGSSELILEQLNRKQNEAKVFLCDASTGAVRLIYQEQDAAWIDVKNAWSDDPSGWEWINGGHEFLWVSEKDGWRHIYIVDRSGKERLLTKGNYDMISLGGIDQQKGFVYFMASPQNATQQYLYRISLKGDQPMELLSPEQQKGTHRYELSPGSNYAFHRFSNLKGERRTEWVEVSTHKSIKNQEVLQAAQNKTEPQVELFQITTDDGVEMDGWMIKPKNFDSSKKYPVLFYVYAEPAGTTVKDAAGTAGAYLYHGDISADGYLQISLDGRGTPAPKGAAWRKSIYRKLGIINIRDQAMAARKIMQWKFVDTSRIAVYGWSGGGSTTLNLLFQYPEIYKTGIAIAPVANQLCYDNIYQERYMGLPQENKADYINGSPLSHASQLKGHLLVIHGTGDDNVHYQGTEMLINELVKYGKQFQMMSYPNRTHGLSEGEGTFSHLSGLFTSFLNQYCPGGGR